METMDVTNAEHHAEHHRIGLDHYSGNASASSSLGLIATLVFGMCISAILDLGYDFHYPIAQTVFILSMSLGIATSLFTMGFSVLDYSYLRMVAGVDGALSNESERRGLCKEVDAAVVQFREMNLAARNSMWLCLLFLVVSSAAHMFQKLGGSMVFAASLSVLAISVLVMVVVLMKFRGIYGPIIKRYG
eukprot:UN1566